MLVAQRIVESCSDIMEQIGSFWYKEWAGMNQPVYHVWLIETHSTTYQFKFTRCILYALTRRQWLYANLPYSRQMGIIVITEYLSGIQIKNLIRFLGNSNSFTCYSVSTTLFIAITTGSQQKEN